MPAYNYQASKDSGEELRGIVTAPSKQQAVDQLRDQGLYIISIEEKREGGVFQRSIFKRVNLMEKAIFTEQMAYMIDAGLPLAEALGSSVSQSRNSYFKSVINDLRNDVESGQTLSASMQKYPSVFSAVFVSMVKTGEVGGSLNKSFNYLSIQLKKEYSLRQKMLSALSYPLVIVVGMVAVSLLLFVFVMPRVMDMFNDLDVELPFTTRIFLGFNNFLLFYWQWVLLVVVAIIVVFSLLLKTKKFKNLLGKLFLKLPIVKDFIKESNIDSFARTLGSLLASGMPILESLEVTAHSLGNKIYSQAVANTAGEVKQGRALSLSLQQYPKLFPDNVCKMIMVGEKTGEIEKVLDKIAQFYDERIDNKTASLSSVIEPILLLVVGLVIGILAVSIIAPIYSIVSII